MVIVLVILVELARFFPKLYSTEPNYNFELDSFIQLLRKFSSAHWLRAKVYESTDGENDVVCDAM